MKQFISIACLKREQFRIAAILYLLPYVDKVAIHVEEDNSFVLSVYKLHVSVVLTQFNINYVFKVAEIIGRIIEIAEVKIDDYALISSDRALIPPKYVTIDNNERIVQLQKSMLPERQEKKKRRRKKVAA